MTDFRSVFGRTEERVARIQESYISQATSSWLESLDRSLTQMKDYQHARKKLDSRRLAYDTSLCKMEKAKREDFRVEEELRSQKVKYEEANDDVIRRMQDIRDAEVDNVMDLETFLDAQLEYHERCREALLQLKKEWPSGQGPAPARRPTRVRSNTAHSYQDRCDPLQEELTTATENRPAIRSNRNVSSHLESPAREIYSASNGFPRTMLNRTPTFEGPAQLRQDYSPPASQWIQRTTSDTMVGRGSNTQSQNNRLVADPYADPEEVSSYGRSSPERMWGNRSCSPATSHGSVASRQPSATTLTTAGLAKKGPPPPPPSRAKKPPPPPPPMKRTLVAATDS